MTIDEMKDMGARRVRLELQPSLRSLGVGDDAYVVIDNVPADAHLSAGYGNADRSWLVPASEFSQVDIVAPDGDGEPVVLNVRVVSLDPNGDSFASTIARFDIHIAPDGTISTLQPSASAPNALRPRSKLPALPGRPTAVNRARADRYLPLVDSEDELPQDVREASHALAKARAAGRDDGAAARFSRAMAKWQAQELQRWAYREAELVRRQRQELAGIAARLRVVEGGREVSLDERWSSKFAELLTAQGAELPTRPQDGDTAYDAAAAAKRSATRSR
ncbi:MAG TPA: hypothetical protein VE914_05210 [Candidatus Angelobacter sp.]|nr:hypothetical protein [Candidatus Angelobacter sp.]